MDNPIALARAEAGMTQGELARLVGVSRDTIAQVETGRIRTLRPEIATVLGGRVSQTADEIERAFDDWMNRDVRLGLSERGRNTLALPVHLVPQYTSFRQWRRDVSPSLYKFAVMVRLDYNTLNRFEKRNRMMPPGLYRALMRRLGLSREYVEALRLLTTREDEDESE